VAVAALRTSPIGIALTRYEVERCTARRGDADWLARAWADPGTRVLVVEGGQALARISDAAAELLYVSPEQAPEGVRFLLGVDAADVAYFGVGAELAAPPAAEGSGGSFPRVGDARTRGRLREAGRCSPTATPGC
jgi:NAD+ diphosphatase